MMKFKTQEGNARAFTLVETLLMLLVLAIFSLTTVAVLKKDQFSAKLVLSKLHEDQLDSPINRSASPQDGPSAPPSSKPPAERPGPSLDLYQMGAKPSGLPEPGKPPPVEAPAPPRASAKAGSPGTASKP